MVKSLWSSLAWSILSKALDRSDSTSAVISFLSIASGMLSVSRMFKVSVELMSIFIAALVCGEALVLCEIGAELIQDNPFKDL